MKLNDIVMASTQDTKIRVVVKLYGTSFRTEHFPEYFLESEEMGKMINWSMKDTNGCVQRGQMFLSQLPKILLSFENSAAETLRRTGADHVLYAVKIYNTADELTAVQFYMNPMSDEEFSKVAGKGRGTMIYALHSRKVKVAG